jgi:anti-anti-sigma regulatory factor
LFIDGSAPHSGTPCPLCRAPLRFVQQSRDGGVVLTFLPDGKRRAAGVGFSSAVLSSLDKASSVVVDLSRLHTLSSTTLDALKTVRRKLQSVDGQMSLSGVHAEVVQGIKKAGMAALMQAPAEHEANGNSRVSPSLGDVVRPLVSLPVSANSAGPEAPVLV